MPLVKGENTILLKILNGSGPSGFAFEVKGSGLSPEMILAVHGALQRLETMDARQAHIVEMKFFGGMRQAEIAEALGVSVPTVERHWSAGRRRLAVLLKSSAAHGNTADAP